MTDPKPPGKPPVPARTRRLRSRGRKVAIGLGVTLGALVLILGGVSLWLWIQLSASLPQLDGRSAVPGLSATVEVERDALGVPTIRAATRADAARALGFVHAQERFFQMDLLRRQGAGELAELFGPAVLDVDREHRIHRFRWRAARIVAALPAAERSLLEAYTQGVNTGLAALGARPPEYLALRLPPVKWRTEDSFLVVYAMYFSLQDDKGARDATFGTLRDTLPPQVVAFLTGHGTEWDAPLRGGPETVPPMPGPDVFDLRREPVPAAPAKAAALEISEPEEGEPLLGSNNWALAGAHTADGKALLANDMHLPFGVPNIWFRASLAWTEPDGTGRRVIGVTLPGTPMVTAGSNGHVAWGFTNSYGDWSDLVELEMIDPEDCCVYRTPAGPRRLVRTLEKIRVRGRRAPDDLPVFESIWGPVIGKGPKGRPRVLAWTAHFPAGANLGILGLETAQTVDEALAVAHRTGIPAQNFTVADRSGRIAWTVLGPVPRRFGFDGSFPTSWADGTRGWNGWLRPEEVPAIVDPPGGRIWTANARTTDGDWLALLGDGGYDLGARARQIRDDLAKVEKATPKDLLAIQLDDRALFLERWRGVLLSALTGKALAGHPDRAELKRLVESTWTGRASIDSVAYRAVRSFRFELLDEVFGAITARAKAADPHFDFHGLHQLEGPLWELVQKRPDHLLDPRFATWDDQLLSAADRFLERAKGFGPRLADRTWGELNTTRVKHPISFAVPALGSFLDVPPRRLSGDENMPRVVRPAFGASERLVVSPGAEDQGIFEMPVGQSGHPLSPYYRAGNRAWEEGLPTPFLPGKTEHRLTLMPAGG